MPARYPSGSDLSFGALALKRLNRATRGVLTEQRPEPSLELAAVLVAVEGVERVRGQDVLVDPPAAADVHDRDDRRVRVELDRGRDRVGAAAVDEVLERQDAVVARVAVQGHDAREVALLDPELGRAGELGEQVRNHAVAREARSWRVDPEV